MFDSEPQHTEDQPKACTNHMEDIIYRKKRYYIPKSAFIGRIRILWDWRHSPGQLVYQSTDVQRLYMQCCLSTAHESAVSTTCCEHEGGNAPHRAFHDSLEQVHL